MIENTKDIDELEFINSFSHSGKPVKDLSRIKALLSDLGDPQDSLKFVHIAGTNGKGLSVCRTKNRSFHLALYNKLYRQDKNKRY